MKSTPGPDDSLKKVLDGFAERLAALDVSASEAKPVVVPPRKPDENADALWRRLRTLQGDPDVDPGRRLTDLSSRLDAELAKLGKPAPRPAPPPAKVEARPAPIVAQAAAPAPDIPAPPPAPAPATVKAPAPALAPVPVRSHPAPAIKPLPAAPAPAASIAPAAAPIAAQHAPHRSGRGFRFVLVGCAAALMIFAGLALRRRAPPSHQSFALAFPRSAGLAADLQGQGLLALDPERGLLFSLDLADASVKSVRKFSNPAATGLAFGGDCLWSSDRGSVFQHELVGGYSIRKSFDNPLRSSGAVFWDGQTLWLSDAFTGTIGQFAVEAGTLKLLKRYVLKDRRPVGLAVSGGFVWILDGVARDVYRYRIGEAALDDAGTMSVGASFPADAKPTGLVVDASKLWVLTENPVELHRFELAAFGSR